MEATSGTLDICFRDAFDPPQNHIRVFIPEKSAREDGGGGDPEEPGVHHTRHGRDELSR